MSDVISIKRRVNALKKIEMLTKKAKLELEQNEKHLNEKVQMIEKKASEVLYELNCSIERRYSGSINPQLLIINNHFHHEQLIKFQNIKILYLDTVDSKNKVTAQLIESNLKESKLEKEIDYLSFRLSLLEDELYLKNYISEIGTQKHIVEKLYNE